MRKINPILAKDLVGKLIRDLATRPNDSSAYGGSRLSPQQVKERFDALGLLLVDKINEIINDWNEGAVSDDEIEDIIRNYLEENPIEMGATPEQVAQIEQNTQGIESHEKQILMLNSSVGANSVLLGNLRDDLEEVIGDVANASNVYPLLGLSDQDPSTWGTQIARRPWYACYLNRVTSAYQLWEYDMSDATWKYVKDFVEGDMMLMIGDSDEGSFKSHRKYDIILCMGAYKSDGTIGLTLRTILHFPYDLVEQNASDIAEQKEKTSEIENGLAAISDTVDSMPSVYPTMGISAVDPSEWTHPGNFRSPMYACFVNRSAKKYELWLYNETINAWEYNKDLGLGDMLLIIAKSTEDDYKETNVGDIWVHCNAHNEDGSVKGKTIVRLVKAPDDSLNAIVEQNTADIAKNAEDIASNAAAIYDAITQANTNKSNIAEMKQDIDDLRGVIPTDDHINGLINSALGVIENGTY